MHHEFTRPTIEPSPRAFLEGLTVIGDTRITTERDHKKHTSVIHLPIDDYFGVPFGINVRTSHFSNLEFGAEGLPDRIHIAKGHHSFSLDVVLTGEEANPYWTSATDYVWKVYKGQDKEPGRIVGPFPELVIAGFFHPWLEGNQPLLDILADSTLDVNTFQKLTRIKKKLLLRG